MSPLAMAEWIEMLTIPLMKTAISSPLAMAEWIEIGYITQADVDTSVSASDGGVD